MQPSGAKIGISVTRKSRSFLLHLHTPTQMLYLVKSSWTNKAFQDLISDWTQLSCFL